ncbi:MAG: GGDEF domain-containing protein [Candidatus Melainabacteria bacterium]|nr:GGDEF domain-containing protein [Candidatus Melainabacteria bacterium]
MPISAHSNDKQSSSDRAQGPSQVSLLDGVGDALHAAAYTAVEQPLAGTAQVIRHTTSFKPGAPDLISKPSHDSNWTKAGTIAGSVVEFAVLAKGVGVSRAAAFGRATTVPIVESAAAGGLYELTVPIADKDFGVNKLRNIAIGVGTFATMDGASLGLKIIPSLAKTGYLSTVGTATIAGAAGGISHATLTSALNDRPLNYHEIGKDAASYAVFGAMFGTLGYGTAAGKEAISSRLQARVSEGKPYFSLGPIEVHPKGYSERAKEFALVDGLTGLKNKTGGQEALRTEVARSGRENEPLSMTYLDLDNFKAANDNFGHNVGDAVLKKASDMIKGHFKRATDIHVREGGDEFMIVMPKTDLPQATQLAQSIEQKMRIGVARETPTPRQLSENYPAEVTKLKTIPRSVIAKENQTLEDLAETLLKARSNITGEKIDAANINAEVARLQERTGLKPGQITKGQKLEVYNDHDIAALGDKTAYRFLPQIGQLLKVQGGIKEEQIQEALRIQSQQSPENRQLIGQILVEKKFATQAQIDQVFEGQRAAKQWLRELFHSTPAMTAANDNVAPKAQINLVVDAQGMLTNVPQVPRPNLDKSGIRPLQVNESPVKGEIVVGVSAGVVQLNPNEGLAAFKGRGDAKMFEQKQIRKEMGLRYDRAH